MANIVLLWKYSKEGMRDKCYKLLCSLWTCFEDDESGKWDRKHEKETTNGWTQGFI